ncbi:iron chelate uptake ABC transporter family permease subunit [Chishuiella sp.]|uniref:iron chelate uptake ABC transporter family permease subunit n=1 Tax=Chishuiella sp. TaxID=1969467 RepID=UPI0028B209D3|nr:iron chelate uptake ABC transporter family permease subunit [Chishuiella sp.]
MTLYSKKIIGLLVIALISILLYLLFGLGNNWHFSIELRFYKLVAITIVSCCIGFSSISFQTITNNKILTPSIMGFEAVYLLLQSILVFIFSDKTFKVINSFQNFCVSILIMIGFSILIYSLIYKKIKSNLYLLVLVGLVFGMIMDSFSSFIQLLIDPNDFFILQGKMFASFNKINKEILWYTILIIIPTFFIGFRLNKKLDIISLEKENAISLGVNYNKIIRFVLIIIAVLVSLSTALIGPIGFLGLLTANLSYVFMKTYRHKLLLITCCLISFVTIVIGQFVMEHFLNLNTPLSTIINFIGGIYFMVLVLKSKKL